jgi:hypothetical protein
MHTKRHRSRKNRTRKMTGGKKWGGKTGKTGKTGKKWTTAIEAAQKTLSKTGSIQAAKKSLRRQALTNARKLFGSVGSI